ncbi:MAG TPA: creatininase family protein, partial [Pirellulaceae bacterium]
FLCFWPQVVKDVYASICKFPDDHAGEMETSLALAYFPHLVARHADGSLTADLGTTRPFQMQALREGWVSITRPWHLLTTQSGAGNPHAASASKGEQLMRVLVERIGDFLVELAETPLDADFPFSSAGNSPHP